MVITAEMKAYLEASQETLPLSSLPAGSAKCLDFLCHFFH